MTSDVFSIETRQHSPLLFGPHLPLAAGQTVQFDPREVLGYGVVRFLIVSDKAFTLRVEESVSLDGPWVQTLSQASIADPAGSSTQFVSAQVVPSGVYMRVFVANGSEAQTLLEMSGRGLPVAGSASSSGGGGGGSESLEQARANGDTFTGGDVFWDDERGAVFGKASGELNQDFLEIFSDKANGVQVINSDADVGGTIRPISIQIGGVEVFGVDAAGATVTGKLTVTGPIDPTSVSLSGTAEGANVLYFDSANGEAAPVSAAGHARIRYNDTTKAWEQSIDGGAYVAFGGGGGGGVSGSGAAGQVAVWSGATSLQGFTTFLATATNLYSGATGAMGGIEVGYENRWRFSGSAAGVNDNLLFLVDSTNSAQITTVLAANDQGVGASILSCGSTFTPRQGLIPGDHGLVTNTIQDIDPAGDAGLVVHSGILPMKFITTDPNTIVSAERMRFTPAGKLIYGATAVVGSEDVRLVAATRIDGSLTVFGDDTAQSYSIHDPSAAKMGFFASVDSESASVSAANTGRIRYNNSTKTWQASVDTGPYQDILTSNIVQGRYTRNSDQTITTGSIQTVVFDTAGFNDGGTEAVTVSSGVFTVVSSGTYEIGGRVLMAQGDADGVRECYLYVDTLIVDADNRARPQGADDLSFQVMTTYQIAAGHTFQIKVFQNSGESLDIHSAGNLYVHIWWRKVNSLTS